MLSRLNLRRRRPSAKFTGSRTCRLWLPASSTGHSDCRWHRHQGPKDFALLYPHFDAEFDSLNTAIPRLTDAEVVLRLVRLIASAGVGHNRIQIPQGMGFASRLPVSFYWFADGPAVTAATAE